MGSTWFKSSSTSNTTTLTTTAGATTTGAPHDASSLLNLTSTSPLVRF
jgi:hypothetical protein